MLIVLIIIVILALAGVTGIGTYDSRDTAFTARTSASNRPDRPTDDLSEPMRRRRLVLAWQDCVHANRRMREIGRLWAVNGRY